MATSIIRGHQKSKVGQADFVVSKARRQTASTHGATRSKLTARSRWPRSLFRRCPPADEHHTIITGGRCDGTFVCQSAANQGKAR
jgi:hypothetical protein